MTALTAYQESYNRGAENFRRPNGLGLLARVAEWWSQHQAYNRTVKELSNLTDRELEDLGVSRFDIPQIAMDAVAGRRDV